jgi:hypothetical protein
MQLRYIFCLSFASTAIAAPVFTADGISLDLQTVTDALTAIQTGLVKTLQTVKDCHGDSTMFSIQASSDELKKLTDENALKIAASPAMGLMDAINILGPIKSFNDKVDELVAALASKKDEFIKTNQKEAVVNYLKSQRDASDEVRKAIIGNLPMPGSLGGGPHPLLEEMTTKLNDAIKAWSS